jgi:hypothetical protein
MDNPQQRTGDDKINHGTLRRPGFDSGQINPKIRIADIFLDRQARAPAALDEGCKGHPK